MYFDELPRAEVFGVPRIIGAVVLPSLGLRVLPLCAINPPWHFGCEPDRVLIYRPELFDGKDYLGV